MFCVPAAICWAESLAPGRVTWGTAWTSILQESLKAEEPSVSTPCEETPLPPVHAAGSED